MTELSVSYSWCGRGARGEAVVGPFEIQPPLDPQLWPGQCISNCRGGRCARGGAVVGPLESQLQCDCIGQHLGFVRFVWIRWRVPANESGYPHYRTMEYPEDTGKTSCSVPTKLHGTLFIVVCHTFKKYIDRYDFDSVKCVQWKNVAPAENSRVFFRVLKVPGCYYRCGVTNGAACPESRDPCHWHWLQHTIGMLSSEACRGRWRDDGPSRIEA